MQIKEPSTGNPTKAFRILVLANEFSEDITQECLRQGFEVVAVSNHNEGLAFLQSHDHVDAAITPAFAEGSNMFEFLMGLYRMPENIHVPVMVISVEPTELASFCTPAVEAAAKLLGAYKFITLPEFDSRQVMRELKALLPERPSKLEA
ncbi:MAG TPA: hypothetical protein V6D22_00270 [Candidatus Obscuribacterales bacterium]